MLVRDLWRHYSEYRLPQTRAPKRYISAWKMLDPYFGYLEPQDIKPAALRWYREERLKLIKPQSLNLELGLLRAVLGFARKEGLVEQVPHIVVGGFGPAKQRVLTKDEQSRLLRYCGQGELKLFVSLALLTAQRKSAIIGLTWDRVDWEARMVDFNDRTQPNSERMKGRSMVPMTKALEDVLSWWRAKADSGNALFPTYLSAPSRLNRRFEQACKKAELWDVTPHTLRHTVATNLVRSGISLLEVSRLLGHKTVATTERNYLKLSPSYLKNAVSKLTL